MNEIAKVISGCFLVVALASPALAHHSAAAYDTQKEVRLTGTITQYRFGNPHVYMILQVKKADGSTKPVEVEAGAASVLNPLGFKKDSLAAGDVVTVVGNPGRDNPDKFVLGKDLYKQDGSYIPLNIASRSIYTSNSNETASSIAGTWFPPRTEF
ncbi:MAG: hypothetical protein DMG17_10150, partial [Acidobacteria bacterium]